MTNYAKGRRAEWAVRDKLQEAGAIVVRSAGSKSPADLVAMFQHRTYAIQVKCAKPTPKEREGCCYASEHTEASWVMVWWEGGKATEVEAWKSGKPYRVLPPGLQE
jgi:Holliday junction resolvase